MPRFRFTIWRMMVAVATLAVGLGALLWIERERQRLEKVSAEYLSRTLEFSKKAVEGEGARLLLESRLRFQSSGLAPDEEATIKLEIEKASKKIQHAKDLQAKYARALRYPWLPVVPDLPEPK